MQNAPKVKTTTLSIIPPDKRLVLSLKTVLHKKKSHSEIVLRTTFLIVDSLRSCTVKKKLNFGTTFCKEHSNIAYTIANQMSSWSESHLLHSTTAPTLYSL